MRLKPLALAMLNAVAAAQAEAAGGRAALTASLEAHVAALNADLDPHEQLVCLVIVTEPWTVDNGVVTPTFKVRRNRVEDVYAQHYERWVVERRAVIWHEA